MLYVTINQKCNKAAALTFAEVLEDQAFLFWIETATSQVIPKKRSYYYIIPKKRSYCVQCLLQQSTVDCKSYNLTIHNCNKQLIGKGVEVISY
jgi:hypothetical protein